MADGITSTLGLIKPEYDGSADTWGPKLNENADKIDAAIAALRARGSYQAAEFGTFLSTQQNTDANANIWTQYPLGDKFYDPQNILSVGANQFVASVNVAIEWDVAFTVLQDDASSYYPTHQQVYADFRLWNITSGDVVARGFRGSHSHTYSPTKYPNTTSANNSGMQGAALVHCTGGARLLKDNLYKFEYYHRRPGTSTRWFLKYVDNTAGQSNELTLRAKVWNLG